MTAGRVLLFLLTVPGTQLPAADDERPNIIVIFTDDQGWSDLGAHGVRDDVATPHLDALAAEGALFRRGYVSAPQCVPSRAGLLTGRYQTRFGLEQNPQAPLTLRERTLAERLGEAGYATGMVGKWHLSYTIGDNLPDGEQPRGAYEPRSRGFADYFAGNRVRYEASFDLAGDDLPMPPQTLIDERYRIDVQTDAALGFLRRHAEGPFFLYLAYFAPHVPLEQPEPYMSRFSNVASETRRMGLAAMSAIDDGVGRVRGFLNEHELEEETLIFYISDNGAPTRSGAWNGSLNAPLVGEKGMLTDGGIRVPFLAAWPGTIRAGTVFDEPVISLDVAATACAVAGLPDDPALDGVNLIPHLTGASTGAPHENLYWRWRSQAAVLNGNWKLYLLGGEQRFLFDVTRPEGERENLIGAHPDVAARLLAELKRWADQQDPPGLPTEVEPPDAEFFERHLSPESAYPAPAVETPRRRARVR